jgi:hypothetical protein
VRRREHQILDAHLGRLREVKRVLELELASHETPERVDFVARSVLGMTEPSADRILSAGPRPAASDPVAMPEPPPDTEAKGTPP